MKIDPVENEGRSAPMSAGSADVGDLLRLFVESVTDYAIFLLDERGFVRTWNPGAARLKGYTESEIVGQHFSKFYTQPDIDAGKPAWELEVAARTGRVEDEGWRLRKDGSCFWANVVITALRDTSTGALIGFAKITRDLTERRMAEQQARELAAETAARQEAERVSTHLAEVSDQLQQQAIELEAQSEESRCLAEELEQANEQLQDRKSTRLNSSHQR